MQRKYFFGELIRGKVCVLGKFEFVVEVRVNKKTTIKKIRDLLIKYFDLLKPRNI